MMAYMKKAASGMQGGSVKGMMGQIGKYAKQVFQNKELWIVPVSYTHLDVYKRQDWRHGREALS